VFETNFFWAQHNLGGTAPVATGLYMHKQHRNEV